MKCPKCGYVRKIDDTNPEWQCPSCQVAYAKVARYRIIDTSIPLEEGGSVITDVQEEKRKPPIYRNEKLVFGTLSLLVGVYLSVSNIYQPYTGMQNDILEVTTWGFIGIFAAVSATMTGLFIIHHELFSKFELDESLDAKKISAAILIACILTGGLHWEIEDLKKSHGYKNKKEIEIKERTRTPAPIVFQPRAPEESKVPKDQHESVE